MDRYRKRAALWPAMLAVTIFFASGNSQLAAPAGIPGFDKIAHFLVYGLLATLTARVLFQPQAAFRTLIVTLVIVSVYGVFDEFRQSFTPGRSVEVGDWLADSLGALLAGALYCHVSIWRSMLEWSPTSDESRARVQSRASVKGGLEGDGPLDS